MITEYLDEFGAADRFPGQRAPFLGDTLDWEMHVSWTEQFDLTPLFAAFPLLEHLEVRGGAGPRFAPMRNERLPSLRRLGPQNADVQNEIAEAVATAPVVARPESPALSMGTLSDQGAEALPSGQPLAHLKELDLHHAFLSDAMADRLKAALPGVRIDLVAE